MIVLIAGAIVIAVSRLHTYHQPLDWDIATYAVIGHELVNGERLYLDAWDVKPPLLYATYALAERITGYGFAQVYLLAVVSAVGTMLGVARAGWARGAAAGGIAAAALAIVGGDMALDANRPNTESFINATLAWAMALLLSADHRLGRYGLIGLLCAAASLYKQVALAPAGLMLLAHVLFPPAGISRRRALGQAGIVAATIAAAWALTLAYFAVTGRGRIFWLTAFVYPGYYGGSLLQNLLRAVHPARLAPAAMYTLLPCAALALPAILFPPGNSRQRRELAILVALIAGTFLAIALPGQFFTHYYQLWLVPATVAAGWGAAALRQRLASRPGRGWLAQLAVAVALGGMVVLQAPAYRIPPEQWAERNYGPVHAWLQPHARELAALLPPGQTFFQWADEPWLYFVAGRRAPAAALWRAHTIAGPQAPWLTARTLQQLAQDPPAMVVVWGPNPADLDHPIARWIAEHYEPLDHKFRDELVFLRRREGN
ncbi:hypothetical protein [Fontivita pretiosa]|uniref:hypothetical protein n=1 Tax=Fontivita pretiosa TaxID=2989684 RepID=UPI003D16FB9D